MQDVSARSNYIITARRRIIAELSWQFVLLFSSFVMLYGQLYWKLATGPWQTEQEGHGPFLIAGAIVIAYIEFAKCKAKLLAGRGHFAIAIVLGAFAAACAIIGQSQDVTMIAAGSQVLLLSAILIAFFGFYGIRVMIIPLLLVAAATPPPSYLVDALTVPLKEQISDAVVWLLYHLGFDIAQNGVIIQAGPYELLVKDACAGMNSIFALSALSIIYVYLRSEMAFWQKFALVLASFPIAILANFIRVLSLCLLAFEFGLAGEQSFHDITGIALFIVAGFLLFSADLMFSLISRTATAVMSKARLTHGPLP